MDFNNQQPIKLHEYINVYIHCTIIVIDHLINQPSFDNNSVSMYLYMPLNVSTNILQLQQNQLHALLSSTAYQTIKFHIVVV